MLQNIKTFKSRFNIYLSLIFFATSFHSIAQNDSLSYFNIQGLNPYQDEQLKHNVNVIILDISPNDLFYNQRSKYIGLKGKVGSSRLIRNVNGWYKGSIKLSNGKKKFFEEVKVTIEIPVSSSESRIYADSLTDGTKIRILGISEEDLYYPNFEKLINKIGTTKNTVYKNGEWWEGEIILEDGYICRFLKVKIEVLH